MTFAIKYKPKSLKEFVNQKECLEKFLAWIKKWKPGSKALLFYGMPGVGKTALVEAFSAEKNFDLIEMNASDFRSASQIEDVLGRSVMQAPLFKKFKIFLIDEVDGIAGREDLGGVGAIIKIIKKSFFPIVLTCNNPYDPKLKSLRQYCDLVQFKKIHVWDIVKRLEYICRQEGIKAEKDLLKQIASRNEGDLRAAINDLETICRGKKEITEKDLEVLGQRERETSIFDALKMIFKTNSALAAKLSISGVDKDPDEIFWWIENNISKEYEKPEEIAKAFDALSKADLFRQRVSSRQNWKLKAYMIDLMTAGIATAKKEMYRKFTKYQYPEKLVILGKTKEIRAEEKRVFDALAKRLHCSTRKLRKEFLPFIKVIVKNKKMAQQLANSLNLSSEEMSIVKKY
ncbi:MAG: replication factor C large subunit [Candidatus Aenigmarchaeota archaeon]|nr:replication factor C large subunit [Candidatus Aenigmarchaeota archaeon]